MLATTAPNGELSFETDQRGADGRQLQFHFRVFRVFRGSKEFFRIKLIEFLNQSGQPQLTRNPDRKELT